MLHGNVVFLCVLLTLENVSELYFDFVLHAVALVCGRLLSQSSSTNRLKNSFVPLSIRLYNSSQYGQFLPLFAHPFALSTILYCLLQLLFIFISNILYFILYSFFFYYILMVRVFNFSLIYV